MSRARECYVCRKAGERVAAVIRIFSGTYGGGFAACREHTIKAETAALEPLLKYTDLVEGYTVRAYSITPEGLQDRLLWTATRREAA